MRHFEITLRHTILGSTPPEEWSTRSRHLYLTTHNKHAPGGIRTPNLGKRAAADALDCAATGICLREITDTNILCLYLSRLSLYCKPSLQFLRFSKLVKFRSNAFRLSFIPEILPFSEFHVSFLCFQKRVDGSYSYHVSDVCILYPYAQLLQDTLHSLSKYLLRSDK
jgi:hypothetical protein